MGVAVRSGTIHCKHISHKMLVSLFNFQFEFSCIIFLEEIEIFKALFI